tara:strand:+ start:564 stop:767 length:204 start_codon:yes stop_codon:yes gene_type:complete
LSLEDRGIPAIGVATTEFIDAATVQAEALGFEPAYIWVPHPIQDRTDDELKALADKHFEEIVKAMTA